MACRVFFLEITTIATKIYGAGQVTFADAARKQLESWNADYGHFPVCMAKTQMSFSADANAKGAPSGHTLNVREVRLANGAGFVVAVCGDMVTMQGLPKVPSAEKIYIDDNGKVSGVFCYRIVVTGWETPPSGGIFLGAIIRRTSRMDPHLACCPCMRPDARLHPENA